MGLVHVYERHEMCWILDVVKWEINEWEIDETDSGIGGRNRLNIGGDGGGGGFHGGSIEMHQGDSDGETLLSLKEAFG